MTPRAAVPSLFGTRDRFCGRQFLTDWQVANGFCMIQVHYIVAHLLLYGPIPNGPRAVLVLGLEVGDPVLGHLSRTKCARPYVGMCVRCTAVYAGTWVHPYEPVSVFFVQLPSTLQFILS